MFDLLVGTIHIDEVNLNKNVANIDKRCLGYVGLIKSTTLTDKLHEVADEDD